MKKFYLLATLTLMIGISNAQWVPQTSGTTNHLNSVYFTDSNTGYAVGWNGTILKTTDGGENWLSQSSGTTNHLNSVFFIDQSIGFVVGYYTLLKTINGGEEWIADTIHGGSSVFFPDPNTGYIAGSGIWKTSDGGQNWEYLQNSPGALSSVYFLNSERGYAVSGAQASEIYFTSDGGANWTTQQTGISTEGLLNSVYFTTVDTGFAVGAIMYFSVILNTTDGGLNWTYQYEGNQNWEVNFSNMNTGYVAGDNGDIYMSSDGGSSWTWTGYSTNDDLHSVYFPVADTGYIVGTNGIILKTTNGGTVGTVEKEINPDLLNCYPNPIQDNFLIEYSEDYENTRLTIYNACGQEIINTVITEQKTQIDFSKQLTGIYFVKVENQDHVEVKKIIKE